MGSESTISDPTLEHTHTSPLYITAWHSTLVKQDGNCDTVNLEAATDQHPGRKSCLLGCTA